MEIKNNDFNKTNKYQKNKNDRNRQDNNKEVEDKPQKTLKVSKF